MAVTTDRSNLQPKVLFDNEENLVLQPVGIPRSIDEKYRQTKRDENKLRQGSLPEIPVVRETVRHNTSRGSLIHGRVALKFALEITVNQSDFKKMMEVTKTHLVDKLDTWVAQKT